MSPGGQGHAGSDLTKAAASRTFNLPPPETGTPAGLWPLSSNGLSSSDSVPETWAFLTPRTLSPVLILETSEEPAAPPSPSRHVSWKGSLGLAYSNGLNEKASFCSNIHQLLTECPLCPTPDPRKHAHCHVLWYPSNQKLSSELWPRQRPFSP